jgi:hypothetical protein
MDDMSSVPPATDKDRYLLREVARHLSRLCGGARCD